MSKNNYVDLKINGRMFPSWILLNFKKYKLPEVLVEEGKDPCLRKTKIKLRKYQEFISTYLDYKSPYKEILLYHGLGSGKTATTINLYNILYNYIPHWNIFILLPASIRGDWLDELKNWLSSNEYNNRFKNIKFIHFDSPYADKNFLDAIKNSDSSKKTLYIIDEVHNFINNVYNNITSKTGRRAYVIYDYIQQEKKDNNETRIMLLTGTPAINNPFELALMFNLLRPDIFPSSEIKFRELYITGNRLNLKMKNMFQRRITGLVSYYSGSSKDLFAEKKIKKITVNMSPYQQNTYEHFEYIEDMIDRKNRKRNKGKSGKVPSTYKSFTRQACNFTFPVMSSKLTGENRPRPSAFKLSNNSAQKLLESRKLKEKEVKELKNRSYDQYMAMIDLYMKELNNYFNNINTKDKMNKKSLEKDKKVFLEKYKGDFDKFWKNYKEKSELLKKFYECSCKMTTMIFLSFLSKGPLIFYSNYVKMEGLEIIKLYLKFFGYSKFTRGGKGQDHLRYTEFHGSISMEDRKFNKKMFNNKENIYGKLIKIILISPAGSEGINLLNVRQVHILEPYWNEVRINQLIGRAVRQCSHRDLPMKERYVDVFRYISMRKNLKETTDENILKIAKRKDELIGSFLTTIKEAAVDCKLFKNHNKDEKVEYKCFKFNQDSLFEKYIGPAFKYNIDYDTNINNGSNSINSQIVKINVKKIKAVKKLLNNKFSDINDYLFDHLTGIVYDHDLEFEIGKVAFDEDNVPQIYKKDIYIISEIIPIPQLKNA